MKNIILFIFIITITSCENNNEKAKKSIIDQELDSLKINLSSFIDIDTTLNNSGKINNLRFYKSKDEYIDLEFYESGYKKSFKTAKNNQCQGQYFDWFENGKISWKRSYNKGHQIGLNTTFYENGEKKQESNTKTNERTLFYENGKPSELRSENESIFFYMNGNKLEEFIHRTNTNNDNNEGYVNLYNEDGTIVFKGEYDGKNYYLNGKKYTGEIICYFLNGKMSLYMNMLNGKCEGKYFCYYGNEIIKYEGNNFKGKEIFTKNYYQNGVIRYENDNLKKISKNYYENGNIMSKYNHLTNESKFWDESGNLVKN